MDKNTVVEFTGRQEATDPLTELLRRGARELLQKAVEAELSTFMKGFQDRLLEDGRAAVVRNGYLPERDVQTSIGPVKVKVPKVRSKAYQLHLLSEIATYRYRPLKRYG
ncbi:transposase [Microbulbifer sp. SH-1]|uniref:transposase n=1 Tax=Microbulbifer sp. SH-1 TaxID=2681547 RepID=UPI00197B4A54|nr:transposase [Microbulbifer sp. SH-1]